MSAITKNLMSVSKFARDNKVYFGFHADKCFVKTQDNSEVVLKVVLNKDDLYSLHSLLPSVPIASINNIIRELPAQCSQDPV